MIQVMLLGDSIRMGYQATVRKELEGWAKVWTSEQTNGGSTVVTLGHVDNWLSQCMPQIVHVNCGLHDLARDPGSTGNRVPPSNYQANVRKILRRLKQVPKVKVIWASTTPTHPDNHLRVKQFERRMEDVQVYNVMAAKVAAELGVPVHDLYSLVMKEGRDRLLSPDGVHFTPEGSTVLGKAVAKRIREEVGSAGKN